MISVRALLSDMRISIPQILSIVVRGRIVYVRLVNILGLING